MRMRALEMRTAGVTLVALPRCLIVPVPVPTPASVPAPRRRSCPVCGAGPDILSKATTHPDWPIALRSWDSYSKIGIRCQLHPAHPLMHPPFPFPLICPCTFLQPPPAEAKAAAAGHAVKVQNVKSQQPPPKSCLTWRRSRRQKRRDEVGGKTERERERGSEGGGGCGAKRLKARRVSRYALLQQRQQHAHDKRTAAVRRPA